MDDAARKEALVFLAEHPHVYLLARRPDGYPTGYAMTARVHDGSVQFSTYRASAKVRNLLRDGVAGVVATDEVDGRVLACEGPIALVDGDAWLPGADPTADPLPAGRLKVPAEVTNGVSERHRDGKRIVLRMSIETARFSRALEPDR